MIRTDEDETKLVALRKATKISWCREQRFQGNVSAYVVDLPGIPDRNGQEVRSSESLKSEGRRVSDEAETTSTVRTLREPQGT